MKRCIIFLSDHLQALGLQQLLNELNVQTLIMQSPDDLSVVADIDYIFTDALTFVAHLKFFLPRQARTLILAPRTVKSDKSVGIIGYDTTGELKARLADLFKHETTGHITATQLLSQREIDVLRLVVSGHINKEIADTLGISINTVLTHRKNITAKLGIKSVSGLSFYAMMNGIIAPK